MGDGTGSTPPGPDRSATPALPPAGVASCPDTNGKCVASLPAQVVLGPGQLGAVTAAAQQALQQQDRARLGQRLVAVAAFGRLDAGRAAGRALAGGDRLSGRPQPVRRGSEAALGEARARPGGRRRRRRSSCPVAGCRSADTPPMSQRSQAANSGSRPIEACSAACAAPARSTPWRPARLAGPANRPPHRPGAQRARRQVERSSPRLRRSQRGAGRTRPPGGSPRPRRSTPGPRPTPPAQSVAATSIPVSSRARCCSRDRRRSTRATPRPGPAW